MKCSTCYRCSSQDKFLQPGDTLDLGPQPTPTPGAASPPPPLWWPSHRSHWRCPCSSAGPEMNLTIRSVNFIPNRGDYKTK